MGSPRESSKIPLKDHLIIAARTLLLAIHAGTQYRDEETIKSYMKMFSDAFGESEEDASRERFLQLAKFGANLLGQPGGDLSGAIGRAAAPSIEGLAAAEAARKAGNREVKLAAIKTAIEQMKDPTADKIRTLARIAGVEEKDVAKLMITGSGDSKMDRIETTAKALATTVGEEPALKIAQVLEEEGAVLAQASPIEIDPKTKKPKEGVSDGYYYDESGKVYKVGPSLGEHNNYVFKEILQKSEDEIKNLKESGVI